MYYSNTHLTHIALNIGAIARFNAFFGQGSGPIWLDDLLCAGSEQRLVDCPVSTGGIGMIDFCNGHADDAGVTCQERKHFQKVVCNTYDLIV